MALAPLVALALAGSTSHSPAYDMIFVGSDTEPGDGYGSSVAVSGNVVAIGAYREGDPLERRGAVYVGEIDADGSWTERAKLVAPNAAAGDQAGFSVALDDDWLAAGAIGDFGDYAIGRSSGRVDVYRHDGDAWTHHATLTRPRAAANDRYGFSLALAGGVLVIGARGVDHQAGAVYVHRLEEPDVAPLELRAPEPRAGDRFGEAVAFDGSTLMVGAPGRDGIASDAGAVFVFTPDGDGWTPLGSPLEPPVPDAGSRFGVGVDVDGEHAIVGASHWAAGVTPGRVWFVSRDAAGHWGTPYAPLSDELATNESAPGDMEGFRVALDDSLAAAGAHLADVHGPDSGAVVTFVRTAKGWRRDLRRAPSDGDERDHFGIALALDDGVVVVGAEKADTRGRSSGGAYLIEPATIQ